MTDKQKRELAKQLAEQAHNQLINTHTPNYDNEALDEDETEEFAKMFLQELDILNGNETEELEWHN